MPEFRCLLNQFYVLEDIHQLGYNSGQAYEASLTKMMSCQSFEKSMFDVR